MSFNWDDLNQKLSTQCYVGGDVPTEEDLAAFIALGRSEYQSRVELGCDPFCGFFLL